MVGKRRTAHFLLERRASASYFGMKEVGIVHESRAAAFSTVSENEKTTMSKIVEEMSPLCTVYEVDFRNVSEGHEIGVENALSGKGDLFWLFPAKRTKARKDDHGEYDKLCANDIKDLVKVLEDHTKPETHGQVFCSRLHLAV